MLDALALCEHEGETETPFGTYDYYAISVADLYPAALDDLREPSDGGRALDNGDVALACTPRDQVAPEQVAVRAAILERARHHFTNRLIEQHGEGVGLHIKKESDEGESAWRL